MKKAIAMLSALAIGSSLIMPISAVAEAPAAVTEFTSWNESWTIDNFFTKNNAMTYTKAELPQTIENPYGVGAWVIYGVSGEKFLIATYVKNTGAYYSATSGNIDYIKTQLSKGKKFFFFPGAASEPTETNDSSEGNSEESSEGNSEDTTEGNSGNTSETATDPAEDPTNFVTVKSNSEANVIYNVEASYSVTIPASVTLNETTPVTATIVADNVRLAKGKSIIVSLTGSSHTSQGKYFHVQTADGSSQATYTINNGKTEIGSEVAEFSSYAGKQYRDMDFSPATGDTVAAPHSETLTFTIGVEERETQPFMLGGREISENSKLKVKIKNDQNQTVMQEFEYKNGVFVEVEGGYSHVNADGEPYTKKYYTVTANVNVEDDSIIVQYTHRSKSAYNIAATFNTNDNSYSTEGSVQAGSITSVEIDGVDILKRLKEVKTVAVDGVNLQIADGDTWAQIAERNSDKIFIRDNGTGLAVMKKPAEGEEEQYLSNNGNTVYGTTVYSATAGNRFVWESQSDPVEQVAVTGVTLNESTLNLTAGGATATLTATVSPENATDKTVNWTSSNTAVATVDASGVVTPVAEGTATITASAGGQPAICTVTVGAADVVPVESATSSAVVGGP